MQCLTTDLEKKKKWRKKTSFQLLIDYLYFSILEELIKFVQNYFWEYGKRLILQHLSTCTCGLNFIKCIDVELSGLSSSNDEQDQYWSKFIFLN